MNDEMANLNRVQDAELLHESIRSMKQASTKAATVPELHALLGHLATAGHLLPEVLTELGQSLAGTVKEDDAVRAAAEACQKLLDEAADLAYRAGSVLRNAQEALAGHLDESSDDVPK